MKITFEAFSFINARHLENWSGAKKRSTLPPPYVPLISPTYYYLERHVTSSTHNLEKRLQRNWKWHILHLLEKKRNLTKAKSGVVPHPELLIIHSVNLYSKFRLLSCRTKKLDLCIDKTFVCWLSYSEQIMYVTVAIF